MSERFVVVGGDAAGMSAASKAKRDDPDLDVVVLERGSWVSYAACGMPYYLAGAVDSLDDLVQVTAEAFREERDVDLRTGHEAVAIDADAGSVTAETADGDRVELPYDHLLVATGAHAVEPPFPRLDLDGVFTIHAMDDAAAIDAALPDASTAAIVGGGYVGVEMAEALTARGLDVHLFEMLPHVLGPFGEPVAATVEEHLEANGVSLHLDTPVSGFAGEGAIDAVEIEDERIPVDVVVVGVGVAPTVDLAADAGVHLGPTGAIATDAFGRTNLDAVYAAGDCAESRHVVTGLPTHVPLGLTANRAGNAIGATVAGSPTRVGEIAGTAIVKAFEVGAARTGLTDEAEAREAGFDPVAVEITAPSRAHYYPGATPLAVRLLADRRTQRVLGGSVVGQRGVKRIDTIATALHAGLTVPEVARLDLAYAPPYSPVWDPVATAARVLAGKLA